MAVKLPSAWRSPVQASDPQVPHVLAVKIGVSALALAQHVKGQAYDAAVELARATDEPRCSELERAMRVLDVWVSTDTSPAVAEHMAAIHDRVQAFCRAVD